MSFFNHGFEFQDYVYNGCHNLTMLCLNISDVGIITIKNVDYRCIIHSINKSEAINLLANFVLGEMCETNKCVIKLFQKSS